jgi:hypothetical protein
MQLLAWLFSRQKQVPADVKLKIFGAARIKPDVSTSNLNRHQSALIYTGYNSQEQLEE